MRNACNATSKTIELRFVILLLLRNEFRHSDKDQTQSELDRIRHDQGWFAEGGSEIPKLLDFRSNSSLTSRVSELEFGSNKSDLLET